MAELKKLQENGVDIYPVTLEDVVFDSNGNTLPNKYQTKEDSTLNTTDKTIVGAINELFQYGTNAKQSLVDTLVAKGISASTSMTFDELINLINDLGGGDSNNLPSWYKQIWIEAKPLPIATHGVAVTSVGNKIYAMNARTGNTTLGNTNYCYNVETNTWEEKATIPTARLYAGASVVGDKIYCISGYALSKLSYDNECYDTSTDTWSTKTNIRYNSEEMACVSIDTNIYCIGGWTSSSNNTSANQCYDTLTDTWSLKTNMPTARGGLTGSATDNKIYCIGGQKTYEESSVTPINECYDVSTDTWSTKANMSISRTSLSSVVVNNKIYCIGGVNRFNSQYFEINECYNISNDTWGSKTNMTVGKSRFGIACVNNMIFCIGGSNSSYTYIDTNYCYIIENDN